MRDRRVVRRGLRSAVELLMTVNLDPPTEPEITRLLEDARLEKPGAADALFERVYAELKHVARGRKANLPIAQTTTLVHEAYLKLIGKDRQIDFACRAHFFYEAARAMRDILVDRARRRSREKHGGKHRRVELEDHMATIEAEVERMLGLHEALQRLARTDPRAERVVMLRFFAGLGIDEIAALLGVSNATVRREWSFAKTLLYQELKGLGLKKT